MTQEQQILNHLKAGITITPLEALNLYGSFRLAAVIFSLREQGHDIKTETESKNGKEYARYSIAKKVGLSKLEWQQKHGFDNEDMNRISEQLSWVKPSRGKIERIETITTNKERENGQQVTRNSNAAHS